MNREINQEQTGTIGFIWNSGEPAYINRNREQGFNLRQVKNQEDTENIYFFKLAKMDIFVTFWRS